jgi:hypothetical protein
MGVHPVYLASRLKKDASKNEVVRNEHGRAFLRAPALGTARPPSVVGGLASVSVPFRLRPSLHFRTGRHALRGQWREKGAQQARIKELREPHMLVTLSGYHPG